MRFLTLAAVLLSALTLSGETLVGVTGTNDVWVFDAVTGASHFVAPTGQLAGVSGLRAMDRAGRRFFAFDPTSGSERIITVDLNSGAVSSASIASVPLFARYDPSIGKVVGLLSDPARTIVSIDPVTGTITPLMATNVASPSLPSAAFDPATRRLFFEGTTGPSDQVYTADLTNNTLTQATLAAPAIFRGYDPLTNRLIGTGTPAAQLVAVDPASGSVQPLFSTSFMTRNGESDTFDPTTRAYFFGSGFQVVRMDLNTSTTTSVTLPVQMFLLEPDGANVSLPALSTMMLMLLAGALALTGLFITSRR